MSKARQTRKRKARDQRSRNTTAIIVGAVIVVGLLLVLAIVISAGGDDDQGSDVDATLGAQTAAVTVTGEPLPDLNEADDPTIGSPAPILAGQDFDGAPVQIADDGRAKAIAYLAHWCPHCQAEVPRLSEYLEQNPLPPNVDLYIVPTATDDTGPNYPPQSWLEREGLGAYPTLVDSDDGTAMTAFGGSTFPFWAFVDSEQTVLGRMAGELPDGAFDRIFTTLTDEQPITASVVFGSPS